jgi:hypothetical protein
MVPVVSFEQGYQKTRVNYGIHFREYPLREERSGGPSFRTPAYFFHAWFPSGCKVASNDSRTTLPMGIPVRLDFSRSLSNNSSGRRIVSVLLIWQYCNTYPNGDCPQEFGVLLRSMSQVPALGGGSGPPSSMNDGSPVVTSQTLISVPIIPPQKLFCRDALRMESLKRLHAHLSAL